MRLSLAVTALAAAGLFIALSSLAGEKPAELPNGYKLLYEQKFDRIWGSSVETKRTEFFKKPNGASAN